MSSTARARLSQYRISSLQSPRASPSVKEGHTTRGSHRPVPPANNAQIAQSIDPLEGHHHLLSRAQNSESRTLHHPDSTTSLWWCGSSLTLVFRRSVDVIVATRELFGGAKRPPHGYNFGLKAATAVKPAPLINPWPAWPRSKRTDLDAMQQINEIRWPRYSMKTIVMFLPNAEIFRAAAWTMATQHLEQLIARRVLLLRAAWACAASCRETYETDRKAASQSTGWSDISKPESQLTRLTADKALPQAAPRLIACKFEFAQL
uniref:Uncharacterized protein n=1 Tax=Mycena chlorophos TaxID=658473 RepID=A0ABQ0MAV9_MYCCL|nr:predicted protein [Mycena chlorophos]